MRRVSTRTLLTQYYDGFLKELFTFQFLTFLSIFSGSLKLQWDIAVAVLTLLQLACYP